MKILIRNTSLPVETKMRLATTSVYLPPSCISSAYSTIKDISVGTVIWLRIQRPDYLNLISDRGKKFFCSQKKCRLWARVAGEKATLA